MINVASNPDPRSLMRQSASGHHLTLAALQQFLESLRSGDYSSARMRRPPLGHFCPRALLLSPTHCTRMSRTIIYCNTVTPSYTVTLFPTHWTSMMLQLHCIHSPLILYQALSLACVLHSYTLCITQRVWDGMGYTVGNGVQFWI